MIADQSVHNIVQLTRSKSAGISSVEIGGGGGGIYDMVNVELTRFETLICKMKFCCRSRREYT